MANTFRLRRFNFFVQEEIPQLPAVFDDPDLLIASTNGQPGVRIDPSRPQRADQDPADESQDAPIAQRPSFGAWDAAEHGYLFLAHPATNALYIVDRRFAVLKVDARIANDASRLAHLQCVPEANVLITVNESTHTQAVPPVVRVWHLDRIFKPNYQPHAVSLQLFPDTPFPVTTLAVLPSLSQLALGFANGMVVHIRGDFSRERHLKQTVIHQASEPITGLQLVREPDPTAPSPAQGAEAHPQRSNPPTRRRTADNSVVLFVTTTTQIVAINTTHAGREVKTVLDQEGCPLHGCFVNQRAELVVAREEAIYFYTSEGRGPCFVFESVKQAVQGFRDYVLILSDNSLDAPRGLDRLYNPARTAETDSRLGQTPMPINRTESGTVSALHVLDIHNKLLAYSAPLTAINVRMVIEWGGVFLVGQQASGAPNAPSPQTSPTVHPVLYRLEERTLSSKLDILYQQNLYPLAIKLATHHQYDPESIAEIYRRYGDYLYHQDDYDGAMTQYLHTVGYIEPSYVIRKFLDAQRLGHLTSYLETLHEQGLATADHTTLLLNCYTKLKDEDRLTQFLASGGDELQFDVDTAIKVCRQAGYSQHALTLAKRFRQHATYLDIEMEDAGNWAQAINYIHDCTRNAEQRAQYLEKYGKRLLAGLPQDTVDLLVTVCTDAQQQLTPHVEHPSYEWDSPAASSFPTAQLPSPCRFQSLFVDHPRHLITFLERVCRARWPTLGLDSAQPATEPRPALEDDPETEDQRAVWKTFLELYLDDWQRLAHWDDDSKRATSDTLFGDPTTPGLSTPALPAPTSQRALQRHQASKRVMGLLTSSAVNYDWDQAFTLCDMAHFDQGIAWLYKSQGKYQELFEFYMDRDEVDVMMQLLGQLGSQEPALYAQTLDYLVSSTAILTAHTENLHQLLHTIERLGLLPPLQVVQILSRRAVAPLGLVKNYLARRLESEQAQVDRDQRFIAGYREETRAMRQEIDQLTGSAVVFQSTKCSTCQAPLDLPAVHFLCHHSYHQRCLGQATDECPRCANENRMVAEIIRSQEVAAGQHERFQAKLENAQHGFDVVAEFFAKNTFSHIELRDQH
ncbi:Vacuolar protein sorting-associated protein 11 [Dimargaris verticillata]|uniref:E3 ubiquitin-protein ligase PEP5 n=1 Tax=Dimargaris verticillata TaxID=2761393 RepID=A0A9W8EEE4_9FUNG|nr:Vacuolar protein sorting-associated protein 11 [Dimargaris verticillata]